MTMSNNELNDIAEYIGKKHDYEKVSAQFVPYDDFKIRWQRGSKWINMMVSDYLNEAPTDVVGDILTRIFRGLQGKNNRQSRRTVRYLVSQGFRDTKRNVFLARRDVNQNVIPDLPQICKEACDALNTDSGYDTQVTPENLDIVTGVSGSTDRLVSVSVLFSTIMVNPKHLQRLDDFPYDSKEILLHGFVRAICHLAVGYEDNGAGFSILWNDYKLNMKNRDLANEIDEILDRPLNPMPDYE